MKLLVLCSLWLSMLAAAGCDASGVNSASSSGSSGPVRTEKLKTNFTVDEARQIAQPASATPGLSVDVQNAQNQLLGSANVNNQMEPPKGLKPRLFGTAVSNNDERFERLEAAVQQLRDDFDSVSPSINRLVAIESEIQSLVDQLQVLVPSGGTGDVADVPPVPAAMVEDAQPLSAPTNVVPPVPAPPMESATVTQAAPALTAAPATATASTLAPPSAPSAPAAATAQAENTGGGTSLLNIRLADHSDSTRIVFETNEDLPYSADVDPDGILIVTFTKGKAESGQSRKSTSSKFVKSIDITPQNGGGFIAAMSLPKPVKILRKGVLKPDGENPNFRIYIDITH